jgi:hypothetical protein
MNLTQLEMVETERKHKRYGQNKVKGSFCEETGLQGLNCKKPGAKT